ncbi:protein adenylyltransferase SelO, mitochondrial-like isoform X1 [Daphnia pulex]|uniref:protein adenylyltransferase SelO, mitochondrial-like isoform X1 n=1 Tax=Daphnia pulex TaxID=6669 RepID=UPI001EE0DA5F|nr:protein adenylyltransferase SelO, mitochondrial-like isoform X1 [Daphnia pulex]XP_046463292.1 protein adenylyltransferase SelO, mitochondrial-like isoform X1 [Daphnia pulex]
MHALGIPTSRAAAIVVSKDKVVRDQFYNGRMKYEPTAVVLRLAPTWFRIGSLEILTREKEVTNLKQVVDFTIEHYMPTIPQGNYLKFLTTVLEQSAALVSLWMAHGFTHGVLNTDNMSLLSITIDYGPFGFLDSYNPSFVPNHSDDEGRYSYLNQPKIFKWNMARLADALQPLLSAEEQKEAAATIGRFDEIYQQQFISIFRRKLGLSKAAKDEVKLVQLLLDMMQQRRADFTQTFRQLGAIHLDNIELGEEHWALHSITTHPSFSEFISLYQRIVQETGISDEERCRVMNGVNPRYVLRNWMAEAAIRQAEKDDFHLTHLLSKVLSKPYDKDDEAESLGFSNPPPDWACSLRVSCSS